MRSYWRIAIILAVITIAALASLLNSGELARPSAEEPPPPQTETLGPADAPITIKAFYTRPGFDAEKTLELLKRFVELYEPGLRVEFVDSSTQMGIMQRASAGLKEDGLTLNGRNEFARIISGELRTIRFLDAPYPYWCKWREVDLHAFVRNELGHLDLDTSVSDEAIAETGEGQTFTVGNPNSTVKVVAYYPMSEDCVDVTFTILREVADAYKDRVYFEFMDTCSDDGFVEWCDAGTVCHGITINGKQEYTVTVDGEEEDITFYAPLDTEWTRAQLEAVIEEELKIAGGDAGSGVE